MFNGKTVIVTGGASGIGLSTARAFATEGATTVIVDLDEDRAKSAAGGIRDVRGKVSGLRCDVSSDREVVQVVEEVMREFGRLDVIVNNAGLMTFSPISELTEDKWLSVLRVDLLGAFYFIREGFKRMQRGSAIVNVSSIHARETTANVAPYAAAKSALVSLTHTAAIEGKPIGIRVTAVLPGAIDTPMLWNNPNIKAGLESIGRGDVGKPDDIARAICFLASSGAEFITGTSLVVDGGRLSSL